MCLLLSGRYQRSGAFAAIANHTRLPRADHERRVVRRMIAGCEFHLESPQQHGPDHFDLLVCKSRSDAAMLPAAESDQRKLLPAVLFAARPETVRIVAVGLAEDMRQAVSYRDRKSTRLNSSHIPLSRMPSSALK